MDSPTMATDPRIPESAFPPAPSPPGPESYADHDAIRDLVRRKRDEWTKGREAIVRAAWRNVLFERGHQWIVFDGGMRRWRPSLLKRNTPRPVTNRFSCLDGDTTIPCLDGTTPTIRDLAERQIMPWIFGFDLTTMRVVPALAERIWKTGERECVRVEFAEGTSVICTPDHKFLTWTRGYIEARDLRPDESIIPCIPSKSDARYPCIVQPADVAIEPIHRLVARDTYGPIPKGHHVHHLNGDPSDNRPENLRVLSASAHTSLTQHERYDRGELLGTRSPKHPERMRALWTSAWYRGAQRIARRRSWANDPSRRQKTREDSQSRRGATTGRFANHRVSAIVPVGVREVFDISTPRTSNFGIGAGVFVHNSTMAAVISVLARIEPTLNFRPGTDDPEDRATADVAIRAIQVIEDEVSLRVARQSLATHVGLEGGAWIETGYDADPVHGMTLMPDEQCSACGHSLVSA